ncbi:MAG: radical SAM protein [Candidatus Pacearchaeota archaeon]|nr:radical SAM protein [Candidatus Pacearchaeota archaeon]
MVKVLFVIPKQSEEYPEYPHTGVGYLSEYLIKNKIENRIIDMRLGCSLSKLLEKINQFLPDFIAITMVTANRNRGYDLANLLKKEAKARIIIGGPHVSMIKSKVLEECKADFAIKCEGEEALLELVRGIKPKKIKNLIYRKNNKIIENPARKFIKNLDKIPWPRYETAELEKYGGRGRSIVTSRGCPYSCIYCSAHFGSGKLFRARSPENIMEEIKYWVGQGIRYFHIVDDNFTFDKKRTIEICNLIIKNKIKATFACDGIRADKVDYEVLKKMRRAGFKYLSFGVESGNNRILGILKKGERIEQIEKAIKDSIRLGFEVYLFFLVGSPGETVKDVQDSINIALKYDVAGANFYNLVPFPGTELYNYVEKNKLFIIPPEEYLKNAPYYSDEPVFSTPEFPRKDRIKMLRKTEQIRHTIRNRVLRKRLSKLGLIGKIAYPFLKYDFIKEVLIGRFLVKIPFVRNLVKEKTEQVFI